MIYIYIYIVFILDRAYYERIARSHALYIERQRERLIIHTHTHTYSVHSRSSILRTCHRTLARSIYLTYKKYLTSKIFDKYLTYI